MKGGSQRADGKGAAEKKATEKRKKGEKRSVLPPRGRRVAITDRSIAVTSRRPEITRARARGKFARQLFILKYARAGMHSG